MSSRLRFNDVDFCLKVRKAGYLIVYDADVKLFHYESKSRGMEDTTERFIRFGNEMMLLNSSGIFCQLLLIHITTRIFLIWSITKLTIL